MLTFLRPYTACVCFFLLFLAGCEKPSTVPTGPTGPVNAGGTAVQLANVTISGNPGKTIPSDFLGLSHEWGVAQDLAGTVSKGKNPIYRQLLGNLMQFASAPVVIRIGGNSTDTTTQLRASDLESLNDLISDLAHQVKFTLGINMGANDPAVASGEIAAISAAIPSSSLLGLELGNEPDSYAANGIRPPGYTFAEYFNQLSVWNQLVADGSHLSPISPALARYDWIPDYENVLPSSNAAPALVTQHFYAGEYLASQPKASDFLLADERATSGPTNLAPYIAAAHAAGKKLRIGELNSLSKGGQPGVSDAFASALWGVDIMFEFANAGADGVNWQSGNTQAYDLFQFSSTGDPSTGLNVFSLTQVKPLFYGLQLFAEATASTGSLLPVTVTTQANVKVWALRGQDGKVRIVVLNKDETNAGIVTVTIAGYSSGTVERLTAPSFTSETNVQLGGQTYDGSTDGKMVGMASSESIEASNGAFSLTMSPVSAALVTIAP